MTSLEKLIAVEDIKQLKAAYFRCMDTKSWEEFPDLFTQDAVFDVRGALEMPKLEVDYAKQPVITGRAAILDFVRAGITPLISIHHGYMPEIEIISPMTAKAIWAMDDTLLPPPGGPFRKFQGYGHYFETYAFNGRWRIATLRLRRLHVEITS